MLIQYLFNALANAGLYVLLALAFGLIYSTAGVFHIALGSNLVMSGYIFLVLYTQVQLSAFLAATAAVMSSIALGVLMEKLVFYPLFLRHSSSFIILISSLMVHVILTNTYALLFGNQNHFISREAHIWHLGDGTFTDIQLITGIIASVVVVCFGALIKKTYVGQCIQAVRDNNELAMNMGIQVQRIRLWVFVIGSALAGIAGVLVALDIGIEPQIGFHYVLIASVAVTVGGLTAFENAILGALFIAVLDSVVVMLFGSNWQQTFVFALLAGLLWFRPEGLITIKTRQEER